MSEAHEKAAEIVSAAQGSIETLTQEEIALKRKIGGLQDEYIKARQESLQKLEAFNKRVEQERSEKKNNLAKEADKYAKTTAMINELSNPNSFRKVIGGIKMSHEDFNTLSGAAVKCYVVQNEADKLRHEVEELKNSYWGERYKSLKNNYDNIVSRLIEAENQANLMKCVLKIPKEAQYLEVSKILKEQGLLPNQQNRGKSR